MDEKSKKFTSRNSRMNLSHIVEGKNPNQLTFIQLHANIQHQKLPSKKPLIDMFAMILISDNANMLLNVNASLSRYFTLLHDQKKLN